MNSPLRYPGGKTRAIHTLNQILHDNFDITTYDFIVSPFCGGCSFELSLINQLPNTNFFLSDIFKPLIIFWQQVQQRNDKLVEELTKYIGNVDKDWFTTLRNDLLQLMNIEPLYEHILEIATEYFIINRCSFSGSTFSGGFSSDAATNRFTKSSINKIHQLKDKLNKVQFCYLPFEETFNLVQQLINNNHKVFIFCDPPYYLSNSKLYGINGDLQTNFNHELFHTLITNSNCDYMITYNNCSYIRELYKNNTIIEANWSYGMNKSHKSSEIVILSIG